MSDPPPTVDCRDCLQNLMDAARGLVREHDSGKSSGAFKAYKQAHKQFRQQCKITRKPKVP